MTSTEAIKELSELMERDSSRRSKLPKVITGARQIFDENDRKDWFAYFIQIKVTCHNVGVELWSFLRDWFDSWLRAVLTGCVSGGIIGFIWRLILLPN
jgi:hypothetical protein